MGRPVYEVLQVMSLRVVKEVIQCKTINGFEDFRLGNGSRQGQDLALTASCVPNKPVAALFAHLDCPMCAK